MKPTKEEMIISIDKWLRFKARKLKEPQYYPRKKLLPKLKRWKWDRLVMVVKKLSTSGTSISCPYCIVWGCPYRCAVCQYKEINGRCLGYGSVYSYTMGIILNNILAEDSTEKYFERLFSSLKERLYQKDENED